MKKYLLFLLLSVLVSCGNSIQNYDSIAQEKFIKEFQHFDEKFAIKREVSWFRAPVVQLQQKKELTGRELIHLCNKTSEMYVDMDGWGNSTGPHTSQIVDYCSDHPDEVCGYVYYFSGTFTSGDPDFKYSTRTGRIIIVPDVPDNEYSWFSLSDRMEGKLNYHVVEGYL